MPVPLVALQSQHFLPLFFSSDLLCSRFFGKIFVLVLLYFLFSFVVFNVSGIGLFIVFRLYVFCWTCSTFSFIKLSRSFLSMIDVMNFEVSNSAPKSGKLHCFSKSSGSFHWLFGVCVSVCPAQKNLLPLYLSLFGCQYLLKIWWSWLTFFPFCPLFWSNIDVSLLDLPPSEFFPVACWCCYKCWWSCFITFEMSFLCILWSISFQSLCLFIDLLAMRCCLMETQKNGFLFARNFAGWGKQVI